ncbi:hypothetical protein IMF22_15690 [Pseudomonas poae]|uniref:Uncharacterized protein n=1 Tax=Pseudomonas poae TaxID=200451 RepID=A0A7M1K9K9_9PSED|nr:hypothetical protein [Pseudomonas poae]QOQ72963.1 hypothetical protein IMF22_15690 [Pseudomonas poae]
MALSNPQVLAMIYAGANVTLAPLKFTVLQRESQVKAARQSKVHVTYIRAKALDHQERISLARQAFGRVHFDLS